MSLINKEKNFSKEAKIHWFNWKANLKIWVHQKILDLKPKIKSNFLNFQNMIKIKCHKYNLSLIQIKILIWVSKMDKQEIKLKG